MEWHPLSWQTKADSQPIEYPNSTELSKAVERLAELPPLVTPSEIDSLKRQLKLAGEGKAFILQGGDCAERFDDCNELNISQHLQLMMQMSIVLSCETKRPVTRISRIAGQYTKPRSSATETRLDISLPSYRGDLVNDTGFTLAQRTPDAAKLIQGYQYASLTINYLRALTEEYRDPINEPKQWKLPQSLSNASNHIYQKALQQIQSAIETITNLNGEVAGSINSEQLYTSHEALNLHYEAALTRRCRINNTFYNLSTHFPWIGMRTAKPESAHVEFAKGLQNPIGIKVGPKMTPAWLMKLLKELNPLNELGKVVLIHRFGVKQIAKYLPALIKAVQDSRVPVVWLCDPMHGNTFLSEVGLKTRQFKDVVEESRLALQIHKQTHSILAGLHIEMTGNNVTECIGGPSNLQELHLKKNYQSAVDPRLNYQQAMELGVLFSQNYQAQKTAQRPSQTQSKKQTG
jgi:3-deoxy-7-phosphoheptulonate synthase